MIYVNKKRIVENDEWEIILTHLNLYDKLKNAKRIAVKPNLAAGTYVDPKTHVTTDLNLLGSFIQFVGTVNSDAHIYIVESDSTGNGFAYIKFERLNLPESLELSENIRKRVKCMDLTRDRLHIVENNGQLREFTTVDKQLLLSEQLMEMDFTVSMSNLKTHAVTGYTGACKNLFGCLPAFDKSIYHPHIHKVIHDLTLVIRPDLNIVDAFFGMEQNGPVQGIAVDSGYRIISDDPVEADDYAASSIGLNPTRINYLKLLHKTLDTQPPEYRQDIVKYRKPQKFLRVMNGIGLLFQRAGQAIASFGHRIHSCYSPFILVVVLIRPILIRFIDINKLKELKAKFIK